MQFHKKPKTEEDLFKETQEEIENQEGIKFHIRLCTTFMIQKKKKPLSSTSKDFKCCCEFKDGVCVGEKLHICCESKLIKEAKVAKNPFNTCGFSGCDERGNPFSERGDNVN